MSKTTPKKKGCHSGNCDSQLYRVCEKSYSPIITELRGNVKHGIKMRGSSKRRIEFWGGSQDRGSTREWKKDKQ